MPLLPRRYPYYRKDSNTVYATAKTQDGRVLAILHATVIVEEREQEVGGNYFVLDHGGHRTPTTIRAINRTASAWGLGFEVHSGPDGAYKVHMAFEGHSWSLPWSGQTVTFAHPQYGPPA